VVGHPEWFVDERFSTNEARVANRSTLVPFLEGVFATRPAGEWLAALADAGVPCSPIRAMDEVFASPEGVAMVQEIDDPARGPLRLVADPIRFDGQMLPIRRPPPTLGEHSELLDD
jgi:crotonobetainyl-CoA:carnitine CoA-transferase CaiB-like acyl-CoA transferase